MPSSLVRPTCLLLLGALAVPAAASAADGTKWSPTEIRSAESSEEGILQPRPDGSLLLAGIVPDKDVHEIELFTELENVTGLRIEALPDPSLPHQGPGCAANNGNFVLTEVSLRAGNKFTDRGNPVGLRNATASHSQNGWAVAGAVDGNPKTGWAIQPLKGKPSDAVFELSKPVNYRGGANLTLELRFDHGSQHVLGHYRISVTDQPGPMAETSEHVAPWADVQKKVNEAISKGCDNLLSKQQMDGSFPGHLPAYPTGETALALYTLVKSGVPKDHPSVLRAAAFVRARMPIKTYAATCQILAYAALKDPQDVQRIKDIGQLLVDWQHSGGGWAYPGGAPDLSCTQYGALGLWTAAQFGFKVPREVWPDLERWTLTCAQEGKGAYEPSGFSYRPGGKPTASMTAAGVAVMAICEEMGGRRAASANAAKQRGIEWLTKYFSVSSNMQEDGPAAGAHLHYYLYGLERVGALVDVRLMGNNDWYQEGARFLTETQRGGGEWGGEVQTCFALLFLSKATKSLTGGGAGASSLRGSNSYGGDDDREDVNLRASGDTPLTVWLSSFGVVALSDCKLEEDGDKGLRVKEVEYVSWTAEDPEPRTLEVVMGKPTQPHGTERFAIQHEFEKSGKYFIQAHVTVRFSDAEGPEGELILDSAPLEVEISQVLDQTLLEYASDAERNELNKGRVDATATSSLNKNTGPELAVDDFLARAWVSSDQDETPKITLSLERPARANTVLLTPAAPGGRSARPSKVRITVNGRFSEDVEMTARDDRKTVWTMPKNLMVRRIEVEILERRGVSGDKKAVGLAEIEIQYRR